MARLNQKLFICAFLWCVFGAFNYQNNAAAQSSGATEIRVEGAQRIEPDTIRSYVPISAGQRITTRALDEALKKLFATGLFADVIVRREGSAV